jgi:hypothetical protein
MSHLPGRDSASPLPIQCGCPHVSDDEYVFDAARGRKRLHAQGRPAGGAARPKRTMAAAVAIAAAQGKEVLSTFGTYGLAEHSMRPLAPALLLGYGRIAEPAIEAGVRELVAAVSGA